MRIVRNFALYRRKLLVKWFIFQVWLLLQVWESILIVCMRLEKPQFRIGAWTIVVIWPTFKRWKKLFEKMFGLSWGNQLLELLWIGVIVKLKELNYIWSAKVVHHFLANQLAIESSHENDTGSAEKDAACYIEREKGRTVHLS